jgi:hypothetical protein
MSRDIDGLLCYRNLQTSKEYRANTIRENGEESKDSTDIDRSKRNLSQLYVVLRFPFPPPPGIFS